MTTNQYNSFKKELIDFGYAYYPDQPYEGRNVWIKYLIGKGIRKAFIRIDEYRHENTETAKTEYILKFHGVIRDEIIKLTLDREFEDLGLKEMEETVQSYYNKLFDE